MCIECPDHWKVFENVCVQLKTVEASVSWSNARQDCTNSGGDLLDIQSENFFDQIAELVNFLNIPSNFYVNFETKTYNL
jgi:hypothetical protein